MNIKKTARNYVPDKISRLIKTTERLDKMQSLAGDLGEEIVLDIIDGWTTGDKLLDFVLVACNGAYNVFTLCMQYRRLVDLGLRKPNQQILVVQKAEYWDGGDVTILRNVYLAHIRPVEVGFDINTQSIHIPVEPGYLVWQEFRQDNLYIHGHKLMDAEWLTTGLLHNEFCDYGTVNIDKAGLVSVPYDSVCDIELLPIDDKQVLFNEHGIDKDILNYLYTNWTRARSSRS